ncbi:hypothetical protein ACOKW7_16965 [Limnospira platensis CENA597]|uniref:hypothetical protein n=1 Tax=Limnospira platensis TaxID=118562 RepID=UPI003DA048ED
MVFSDHEVSINLKVNPKLWQDFQQRCATYQMSPEQVLVGFIKIYLAPLDHQVAIAFSPSSEGRMDLNITQIIEDYLQQNLEPQIQDILQNYIDSKESDRPSAPPPSASPASKLSNKLSKPSLPSPPKPSTKEVDSRLKTGKELAEILGVSAPYITTLNRLGELHKRGWQDSGQRRGKTILYEPVSPP